MKLYGWLINASKRDSSSYALSMFLQRHLTFKKENSSGWVKVVIETIFFSRGSSPKMVLSCRKLFVLCCELYELIERV